MNRRDFLGSCALLPGIAALATADASADPTQIRRYTRSLLVDIHGAPIRPAALAAETNYVFQYPFAATPCFLLRLPEPIAPVPSPFVVIALATLNGVSPNVLSVSAANVNVGVPLLIVSV